MKKILIIGSIALNIVLLAILAIYQFTPYLDFAVIQKSIERVCTLDSATEYPLCNYSETVKSKNLSPRFTLAKDVISFLKD